MDVCPRPKKKKTKKTPSTHSSKPSLCLSTMSSALAPSPAALPCEDFSVFSKLLYEMRKVDDTVITELNGPNGIPTSSFKGSISIAARCTAFHEMVWVAALVLSSCSAVSVTRAADTPTQTLFLSLFLSLVLFFSLVLSLSLSFFLSLSLSLFSLFLSAISSLFPPSYLPRSFSPLAPEGARAAGFTHQ